MSRSRAFAFTFNNYTPEDEAFLKELEGVSYMVFGHEICPTTGTPHLQGYVYFGNPRSIGAIRKLIKCHIDIAKGDAESNRVYCTKEDTGGFFETGLMPASGKRNDLVVVQQKIDNGMTWEELMVDEFENCAKYHKFFKEYCTFRAESRNFKTQVNWFWGPTGTGKSRLALEEAGSDAYWKNDSKWWCGYSGQENVIIDDIRAGHFTFNALLRLLDRYPLKVEVKGGTVEFVARTIWITCPYSPDKLYEEREDIGQLLRRVDRVVHFENLMPERENHVVVPAFVETFNR